MKTKKRLIADVECYRNYFMVGFRNIDNGKVLALEHYEGHPLDVELLDRLMRQNQIITFNGNHYDVPMIFLAITGASNAQLKRASDSIIMQNLKSWEFENAWGVRIPKLDHIDLIEVAPGQASLKLYGGRVHTLKMQDLPIEPDATITQVDRINLVDYNGNDLNLTIDVMNALKQQLELRQQMSEEYGLDLRSKSDAQIAEAVIKMQIEKITGVKPQRPDIKRGTRFKYQVPDFLQFQSETMLEVLERIRNIDFFVTETGKVELPEELEKFDIRIGGSVYRMGNGGLHSTESSVVQLSDEDHTLYDRDVRSYYPSIILALKLFPPHLGAAFLKVFKAIVDRRLAAKDAGITAVAEAMKIMINGTFGKLGSKWSCLYSPNLLLQVTITGQLTLLMLIERLELAAIPVVSANTDGAVIRCPNVLRDKMLEIVKGWEKATTFETEEVQYAALYSRDVNNYIAIYAQPQEKKGQKVYAKLKGAFAPTGLQKNPTNQIAVEAAVDYLVHDIDINHTVRSCEDIRKFVSVRTVQGGAIQGYSDWNPKAKVGEMIACLERSGWQMWPDKKTWANEDMTLVLERKEAYRHVTMEQLKGAEYIGKAVRWYYGVGETRDLRYKTNSNSVPRTRGAVPIMELPEEFPSDVNHDWYVREAYGILRDVGHPRFQWHDYFDDLI